MKNRTYLSQILMSVLILGTLGSCEKCFFKKTATGLEYKIVKKGPGPKPQDGQIVLFDMFYKTKKGDIIFNSADQEMPLALQYADSVYQKDGGLKEVISMLEKGDSTIFKLNAKTLLGAGFEQVAAKHHLSDQETLLLHMHVQDVMSQAEFRAWEEKKLETMEAQWKEKAAKQLQTDIELIDNYLKEQQLTAQSTDSGLRYIIDKPGQNSANMPKPGNTVKVHYTGKTLAGKVFDTSLAAVAQEHGIHNPMRTYEPLEFKLGQGQVIPGWEEGIMLLSKGTKARLFIPSPLAYGTYAIDEVIKANTILIFEVELVDIR